MEQLKSTMGAIQQHGTHYIKMRLALLCLLSLIFLVATVRATTEELPPVDLGAYPQNVPINLVIDCDQDGGNCVSTSCNITQLKYPNSSLIISNRAMGTAFPPNYNITIGALQDFGPYYGTQRCYNSTGGAGSRGFTFEITADGKKSQPFPTQLIILIGGFLLVATGIFIEKTDIFKHVGAMVIMIMGVLTIYPGYSYINHTNLTGLMIGTGSIGIGFLFLMSGYFEEDSAEREEDD